MSSALDTERRLRALEQLVARLKAREYAPRTDTYTPTYVGGTSEGVTTYAADGQVGSYVLVGPVVLFQARVAWTNATGTGEARVSLPFFVPNVTNQAFSASLAPTSVTYSQDYIVPQITPNTQYISFRSPTSDGLSTIVNVETTGILVVSGFYWRE